jgi:hypothetical protein
MIVIQDLAFEPEWRRREAYHAAALASIAGALTRHSPACVAGQSRWINRYDSGREIGGHNIGPGAAELKAVQVLSFERELLISADPKRSGAADLQNQGHLWIGISDCIAQR